MSLSPVTQVASLGFQVAAVAIKKTLLLNFKNVQKSKALPLSVRATEAPPFAHCFEKLKYLKYSTISTDLYQTK